MNCSLRRARLGRLRWTGGGEYGGATEQAPTESRQMAVPGALQSDGGKGGGGEQADSVSPPAESRPGRLRQTWIGTCWVQLGRGGGRAACAEVRAQVFEGNSSGSRSGPTGLGSGAPPAL